LKSLIINKCEPLVDDRYHWYAYRHNDVVCYVKGWLNCSGRILKDLEAARQIHILLYGLFSEDSIAEALDKMEGNFAFIYQATDQIVASVDKVRSYPLFWGGLDNALFISNSAQMLQQELGLNNKDKDPEAVIELKMAGYVTGTRTLFQDVKQIQPGEFLWVNSNGVIGRRQYYRFYAKRKAELKLGDWIDRLAETTQKVFQDIIDKIDGRQVWIPLSGGLDSRLVLAMFKELGYDNLVTFSYGLSGNWEAKVARQVAQDLGVRWHPMFFRRDWSSMFFFTKIREDYFSFANNLSTVPFLPDFYGLYLLRQEKLIPDEAVIINGQSGDFITGGHIPSFHKTKRDILWAYILECIVSKHYSLWDNLKTQKNIDRVNNRILGSLRWYKGVLTSQSAVDLMEHWEWQERQCKYVINGQRRSVCDCHDLGALATLCLADSKTPFFAGAKLPSMNASLISIFPRSYRSLASSYSISWKVPRSVHSWKRRWQVWYGGYLAGKSFQGAPVRNIHNIPLSTSLAGFGFRPRGSFSGVVFNIMGSIRVHCSFVSSILILLHNQDVMSSLF
jgi:hypothetical protein